MACALIGGAVLGAVAGELLKAIINFKRRAGAFKSRLEHLESNLLSLNPICVELEELYRKHGRYPEIEEFIRSLNKGKGLVEKCSKVHRLNIYLIAKFSKDLQKLDYSILRFCNVDLSLHISTTVMRTSITTNELSKKFDTYLSIGQSSANETGFGLPFSYSPKKPPPFTVGLEVPLRELKTELKKDTDTVLVLCGPGGSMFLADHKHFTGKHTLDLEQDAPEVMKKMLSEQTLGEPSAQLPNKTRRKAITHLEEELAEVNAGIISMLSRKKKITKLLVELRYPDEEEADDDSEDDSDY